ncbi:MAG: hypothetical protein F7C33_06600 [Desulfurococcales archaeon]|nr:hypothetical protein [Desulfurococcales archaeon]
MKKLGVALIVIALIGLLVPPVFVARASSQAATCKYYFIIYGQDWCPHCQNMERFVIENYGAQCLEFRDLDVPRWNQNFTMVVDELNNKYKVPTQAAFPLTGILEKGKLRAILQGEITSKQVIEYLVKKADKEGPEWITVYTNGLYEIKPDDVILHAFEPEHPGNSLGIPISSQNSNSNGAGAVEKTRNNAYIAAGLAVIVAGIAVSVYLARH